MSATTGLVGLLGFPVGHSLSPAMHEAAFAALGLDLRYQAFAVEPARLGEAIRGAEALGLWGLNVTIPHKVAALQHCRPGPLAVRVGAVNTLVLRAAPTRRDARPSGAAQADEAPLGLNTDVHGFRALLDEEGFDPRGAEVVILGAGGAARAVTVALREAGAGEIVLLARRSVSFVVDGVQHRVVPWDDQAGRAEWLSRCRLLVDATPRGLDPDGDRFDLASLGADSLVVDLVVRPTTALVDAARARSLRAATGESMLLHQGAAAFTAWTGHEAPVQVMRTALRHALTASCSR